VVSNTSIGFLFMAGVIPGLLRALGQAGVVMVLARTRNFPLEPAPTLRQAVRTSIDSFPVLMLPVILIGGIYSGAATPTEAAAVAAF
jgi:TRAP-type C4-dicarboxylate transport system permease large subunit